MSTVTRPIPYTSRFTLPILFALGVVLLVGTWAALYWAESLFTESHLVGYYCCVTEGDHPARGTLERTSSDFFRDSPGMVLPSLLFVAINAGLFALSTWRVRGNCWWLLPYLFVAFNFLYLLVDFWLVGVSWSISERVVGTQRNVYTGYDHTWYGIVLHFIWWGGLFFILSRTPRTLLSRFQAIERH